MPDNTLPSARSLFQFIEKPFSFNVGVAAIASILFLDNYLLLNGSSVREISIAHYFHVGPIFTFFLVYFLCLHVAAPPLRMATYICLLSIISAINKFRDTKLLSLISHPGTYGDREYKSQLSLLGESIEEKSNVKYNLYIDSMAKEKNHVNLQNILFTLTILIPFNFSKSESILRIVGYKPEWWFFIILIALTLFWVSIYQREFKIYIPESFSIEHKSK